MYGIIDYDTRYVITKMHLHKDCKGIFITDYKSMGYVVSKNSFWINKTNWYQGVNVYEENVLIISDIQYQTIVTECEKIIKCKLLLSNSLDALMKTKTTKPKIDDEIIDVDFDKNSLPNEK